MNIANSEFYLAFNFPEIQFSTKKDMQDVHAPLGSQCFYRRFVKYRPNITKLKFKELTLQQDLRRRQINPNLRGSLFMQEMFCDQLGQNITKLNFKVLTLQEDLRRGQIIPKLRGSLSCRTFLHCDGGTILQLGAASNYHN